MPDSKHASNQVNFYQDLIMPDIYQVLIMPDIETGKG
jgi:hypothetical protein